MLKRCSQNFLLRFNLNSLNERLFNTGHKHGNNRTYCSVSQLDTTKEKVFNPENLDKSDKNETVIGQTYKATSVSLRRRRFVHPPTSLAEAVYRSQFLRDLVDMGVNLHKISLRPSDFDYILSVRSWDCGPRERLKFLLQIGVSQESLAATITENPKILNENLEDMEVRVNYLLSKRLSHENVANIVSGCPKLLSMSDRVVIVCPSVTSRTHDIDARLGYFQAGFRLSGDEVRNLVIQSPWLVSWHADGLSATVETLKDKLGFNIHELKELLLANSKIWQEDPDKLKETVHFLHFELGMSHNSMVKHSKLLSERLSKMKNRYNFMVYMKRVNFDCSKEHFTPYDVLWKGPLEDFCNRLHTSVDAYELYIKSL